MSREKLGKWKWNAQAEGCGSAEAEKVEAEDVAGEA